MGKLSRFTLDDISCDFYVETGIGTCSSFNYACTKFDPGKCFGVDIEPKFIERARIQYPAAGFYLGKSTEGLEYWLTSGKCSSEDRVLFFLDAHFPGADYDGKPYDPQAPDALPLREELLLIKKYRGQCQDVIICDDARIYFTGPFERGVIQSCRADHGIDDIFVDRKQSTDLRDEGYFIIKP